MFMQCWGRLSHCSPGVLQTDPSLDGAAAKGDVAEPIGKRQGENEQTSASA